MQVWYVGRNGWVILSILETKKLQFQKHNFLFTKTSCLFLIIKCYLQAKKLMYLRFGFEKRPVHWSCPANLLSFSKNVSGVKKCMYIKKKWVKESWGTNDYYTIIIGLLNDHLQTGEYKNHFEPFVSCNFFLFYLTLILLYFCHYFNFDFKFQNYTYICSWDDWTL